MEYKKEMENKVSTMKMDYDQLKNSEITLKDKLNVLSKSYEMLKSECMQIKKNKQKKK